MTANNQTSVNVIFKPVENKAYSGDSVSVDNFVFFPNDGVNDFITFFYAAVQGQGFLETFDFVSEGYERWDLISYLFFGQSNYLLKLWQTNKHLSEENKRSFAPTPGAPLFLVPLTEDEIAANQQEESSALPPWKR